SVDYPDPVGHLDPWVLLGALAARARRIVLASGAIVLPLMLFHQIQLMVCAVLAQRYASREQVAEEASAAS
ncbi:bile acid:sodium symporter, partial [Pantoea sp. SIMBA_072]